MTSENISVVGTLMVVGLGTQPFLHLIAGLLSAECILSMIGRLMIKPGVFEYSRRRSASLSSINAWKRVQGGDSVGRLT